MDLTLKVAPYRPLPLHLQVESLLRKRLESGEWAKGMQLPSIDQLVSEYGVARVTVRDAMAQLESEGLIRRYRGRGTIATADLSQDKWLILPSDWDSLTGHIDALATETDVIETGWKLPIIPAESGAIAERYWYTKRVNATREGHPYSLAEIYLDAALYKAAPKLFRKAAILPVLRDIAPAAVTSAEQETTISTADQETAQRLGIGVGMPVAEVRRTARDRDGRIIYFAFIRYPARHLKIKTKLL